MVVESESPVYSPPRRVPCNNPLQADYSRVHVTVGDGLCSLSGPGDSSAVTRCSTAATLVLYAATSSWTQPGLQYAVLAGAGRPEARGWRRAQGMEEGVPAADAGSPPRAKPDSSPPSSKRDCRAPAAASAFLVGRAPVCATASEASRRRPLAFRRVRTFSGWKNSPISLVTYTSSIRSQPFFNAAARSNLISLSENRPNPQSDARWPI
jgi:hypothetical protein